MKKQVAGWILVAFVAVGLSRLVGQSRFGMSPGSTLASCAVSTAKELAFCNVAGDPLAPDGLYVSANGAAFFLVGKSIGGGVITFNKRTGDVLPVIGDYTFPMIQGQLTAAQLPASVVCNVSLTVNGTSQKATISACN